MAAQAIDGHTVLVGIIGDPVEHSRSPAMHNAAFTSLGMNWRYLPFRVAGGELARALSGIRGLGIRGLNVTIPHKQAVVRHLDELAPEAALLGAVNTIIHTDGRLVGDNTDVEGFRRALSEGAGCGFTPVRAMVLGAGGAGLAVMRALLDITSLKRIHLLNRTPARADAIVKRLEDAPDLEVKAELVPGPLETRSMADALSAADLVVNATSVGMHPKEDASPLGDCDGFRAGQVVYDLIYNPRETRLLNRAKAQGAQALSGLSMLVHQGARGFELWTGRPAPVEVMAHAIGADYVA